MQAIKTGRYTHAKKTKDIQEVKRLQRKQLLREEQTDSSQLLPCSVHSDVIDDETAEEILDKIMNVHRQQTPHTPEFFEKLSQKEQDYLVNTLFFDRRIDVISVWCEVDSHNYFLVISIFVEMAAVRYLFLEMPFKRQRVTS